MGARISKRAAAIAPSATLAVNAKAGEMKAQGIDVVNFGVGEPDFDTPGNVKAKAIEAIQSGFTKYTPAPGTPALRKAIADKLARENGLNYTPAQTMACVGAKQAIYLALLALVDPGDEVILPRPYWVSYPEMVHLADGVSVYVDCELEDDFKLTPAALRAACTPRTKVLVLNYPNNPTGSSYTRAEIEALAAVCVERGVCVISDEVYEKLIYDGEPHFSFAAVSPEMYDLTVTTNGVSKAYAMTGWRLGYAAGPAPLIKAMTSIQEHMNTHTSSITQVAGTEALNGPQDAVAAMVEEFKRRRDYMYGRFAAMPGIRLRKPPGAFYCFPDVSALYGKTIRGHKIGGDMDLVNVILTEGHVAIVPGGGFGNPNCVRLSYATSMERITTGLDRIEGLVREAR
ncbi:MAG: pyridoxal phosphate-dependent aminotransferase [Bacillota bacterium]|nr:pyridoxal phosphate-dependent aminotransferase [Bacillota bacterium]